MVKIHKINKVYDELLLMLFHLRHLRLKTNGDDQNSKRQKIYSTKLKHLIVKRPN